MGVKEDFLGSSLFSKFAIFVLLAANLFNWIAFCTAEWGIEYNSVDSSIISGVRGLWRLCGTGQCVPVDGPGLARDEEGAVITNYHGVVQAFAIFGFVGINVAFLLVILMMFTSKCKRNSDAGMATVIICFFAAVSYLISVIVFAACFNYTTVDGVRVDDPLKSTGYSLYLAVIAFVLAFVSGALLIVDIKKGGATSPA